MGELVQIECKRTKAYLLVDPDDISGVMIHDPRGDLAKLTLYFGGHRVEMTLDNTNQQILSDALDERDSAHERK